MEYIFEKVTFYYLWYKTSSCGEKNINNEMNDFINLYNSENET